MARDERCAKCKDAVDPETRVRDGAYFYCSDLCKREREDAYDRHVDPLGVYSDPSRYND